MYIWTNIGLGQVGPLIDIQKAIRSNRIYAQQLGWRSHYDHIVMFLGLSGRPSENEFAQAVARWQQSQGMKADGIIGPSSWSTMGAAIELTGTARTVTTSPKGSLFLQHSESINGAGSTASKCDEPVILDSFNVGDYRLKPHHYEPLVRLTEHIVDLAEQAGSAGGLMLEISGHADDTGRRVMNIGLSFNRALEVKRFLVEGIAKFLKSKVSVPMTVFALGASTPIKGAPKSRQRRVEVRPCRRVPPP